MSQRHIIQNFDLVALPVKAGDTTIYLPEDRIYNGRKITRMFFFNEYELSKYTTGVNVVPFAFLDNVFIDLYNEQQQRIFSNVNVKLLLSKGNVDLTIGSELDYTLCEIKIVPNDVLQENIDYVLLVGFEYETAVSNIFVEPSNTTLITIDGFPSAQQVYNVTYKLSDYGGYKLKDKRIRRITALGNTYGYITIRERGGRVLNQIPLYMLWQNWITNNIYFDFLDIDTDNSFIEITNVTSGRKTELTFYYE